MSVLSGLVINVIKSILEYFLLFFLRIIFLLKQCFLQQYLSLQITDLLVHLFNSVVRYSSGVVLLLKVVELL